MRVGITNTFRYFTACGQGQYFVNLLSTLRMLNNSVQYVEIGPGLPELDPVGRTRKSAYEARWELLDVTFATKLRQIDVLHNPYWTSPILPWPKTVVTVHDIVPRLRLPGFEEYTARWRSKLYYGIIARTTKYADAIIADTKTAADDIRNTLGIRREKITVIYLAPHIRFYQKRDESKKADFRRKYGLTRPYILYMASGFDYRKNVPKLIEAFNTLISEYRPDVMLVITGDLRNFEYPASQDPQPIIHERHLNGQVKFTGFVQDDDVPTLYQSAELCVFPSLYEGGGLAMLEAMASGQAILASNHGSLVEIAADAAVFVDPRDQAQISGGLLRLLRDKTFNEELGLKAAERSRRFSWEQTAKETNEVYQKVYDSA